jgi:hypothetical protein
LVSTKETRDSPCLYRLSLSNNTIVPFSEEGSDGSCLAAIERIAGFDDSGKAMFVYHRNEIPSPVFRTDLARGTENWPVVFSRQIKRD